ncbi:MAG: FG-GAP repeat protein, partial [Acidobacteriota bacterium]
DFDLDGVSDLAIGIPGQDMEGRENAGRVAVVYGTAGLGLDVFRVDFFDQRALIGGPETGDQFGATLAAGRLGIDPFPDLAVGVPGEAVSGFADVGAVNIVLSSGTAGLTDQGDQYLHQDVENVFGFASPGDRFGSALAIGDATGDGVGDLVVGTPGDLVGTTDGAGAVQVLPGAVDGVVISSDQVYWTQAVEGVLGAPGEGDEFGSALAFGRFNGDPHLDLAIGVPGESQFGPEESGAVQVLYGTPLGLSTFQSQVFFESLISPEVAVFDRFGDVLAAADFNADGFDELAIGLPRDNVLGVVNAGNVAVLRGAAAGLQSTGAQLWNGFFLLTLEAGDELGLSLATGRFSGGGACDLVIGVPGRESEGGLSQAGGVLIVRSEALLVDGFESGDLDAWSQVFP